MIEYRVNRMDDTAQIAAMSRDLIEYGLGWSWTPRRVRRAALDPETVVLVATLERRMAGFAIMEFAEEHAHLNLLAVRPVFQRRRIGQGLLEWLDASVRVAGLSTILVEVRSQNAAGRRFYRRLGYREIAYLPGYYSGRESAVRMLRDPAWQTESSQLEA